MPSTPSPSPQVVSGHFERFRVVRFDVSAGQRNFCDRFDSRQLHRKTGGQRTGSFSTESTPVTSSSWYFGPAKAGPLHSTATHPSGRSRRLWPTSCFSILGSTCLT